MVLICGVCDQVREWLQSHPALWTWLLENASPSGTADTDTPTDDCSDDTATTVDTLIGLISSAPQAASSMVALYAGTPDSSVTPSPANSQIVADVTDAIENIFNRQHLVAWAVEAVNAIQDMPQGPTVEAAVNWVMENHEALSSQSARKRRRVDVSSDDVILTSSDPIHQDVIHIVEDDLNLGPDDTDVE